MYLSEGMENDILSVRKIMDDEHSISKGQHTYGNGVTSSSTESPDTSSLRRSSRVSSSSKKNMTSETPPSKKNMTPETPPSKKNMTQSPSSVRKSELIEKGTSTTPPVQRKAVRVEKQTESIPLRRSKRGKDLSSPSSSGSKKSDKSSGSSEMIRKKEKKEKSVKQLTMEAKEVSCKREKKDIKQVQVRKGRINAHSYRALLKRNKKKVKAKDHNKELNRIDKSYQGYSSSCEDDNSKEVNELRGIGSDAEQVQEDCSTEENFQSLELLEYTVESGTLNYDICLKRGQNVMPLKRKRNEVDIISDAFAVVASEEASVSQANATPLSPTRYPEICGDKKQRVNNSSTEQEISLSCLPTSKEKMDGGLCDTFITEDRGELQASTASELAAKCKNQSHQNGFHVDIPACINESTCFICKRGGNLLCCNGKGCKRSYHFSCLDPPLKDVPLGVWHCAVCVKEKIESGVHVLSEGVESIWDAKEVEVLDGDGLIRRKEYFVKYKGLAHVHNRWVPESQLLSEVPLLVAKFNRKHQVVRWKQEWTLPHRLLQRRCLTSTKRHGEHFREHVAKDSDCQYEWLVKWRGLDHEHATWELESTSFISSPQGQILIRDYEDRRKRAKQASSSSIEKEQKLKTSFPAKLSAGGSSGFDNNLECVNKLREYSHKRQNAIVFDEQDRIVKVVLFILSLLSDATRPFLIISASGVLHLWEDEFSRTAPSADVVIYNGTLETRKWIRTSEFYEEGGCIMFQALLTSPEVVIEDLYVFESIGWETIIIDACQRSITTHFEQFKMLSTDTRLLLLSYQLKDSITEYRNMLSVLEVHGGLHGSDELMVDANDNIGSLKERLSKYVAYGGKLDFSRFVEYWIPVQISDVQLEQYCSTLLSNSLSLCSPLKHDPVGALHDILISTRKCCDHPYLVDESLQSLVVKDVTLAEYLDVGIKACGKLQLLDTMLSELKTQSSRVLVLFQSIGGGRESISMGDILDDFLRQRFGTDSYERVDGNVLDAKKRSALHNFNNGSERFVFLLETRACRSSIKLSSVHAVIIFHSDWSPLNDLRALQRISLDSQLEQIKVFRLYSSCTVEEKVLILAKQDKTPDGYMQNMRPSTSHALLMWGASYLFNRLDQFHSGNIPASSSSSFFEQSLLKDVAQEFFTILTQTGEDNDTSKFNKILKVEQNQGIYSTTSPLFGELRVEGMDEERPHVFWTKLLRGKHPRWKYSSGSSQGSRKRVQYYDDLQKKLEAENDVVGKKLRKVANTCENQSSLKPGPEEGKIVSRDKEGTSAHSDTIHWKCASASTLVDNISETSGELSYSQKSLHLLLKPEMAKLCEVLQLREDVKVTVEKFLEYVMINHRVKREPATILQAFEISLCWTAASLRKQKIDRKESLAMAKQHLNFSCKKEEAYYVYSLLQCLKEVFELSMKDTSKHQSNARLSQSEASGMPKVNIEFDDWSASPACSDKQDHFKVAQKDFSRSIRGIKKKCRKQMEKLFQKQLEEKEDIDKRYEEEKERLEHKKKTEAAVICSYSHGKMQTDRLKILDVECAKQLADLKHERDVRLENLEALHVAAVNKVHEKETSWVEGVKSWLQAALSNKPSSKEFGHTVACLQAVEQHNALDNQENDVPNSIHISEGQNPNKLVNITLVSREIGVESSVIQETLPDEVVACSNLFETGAGPPRLDAEGDEFDTIASEETSNAGLKEWIEAGNSGNNQENYGSLNRCSREQILDGDMLSMSICMPDGHIQLEVSSDVAEGCLPPVHSSDGQIHHGARQSSEGQVPGIVSKMVSSNDGLEDVVPVNAPSSKDQIPDGATTSMPDVEADSSGNYTENFMDSSQSEEHVNTGALLAVADEEVPLRVSENVYPTDGLENVVSRNPPYIEQIPDLVTSCIPSAEVLRVPESCPGEIVESGNINAANNEAYGTTAENVNHNLHMHEQSPVNLPSLQTRTIIEDRPVPSNQVLQDVSTEPTASTGVQDGDAAASEIQISLQVESLPHPVDVVAKNGSNHGAAATGPIVSEVGHQPSNENCFANLLAQSPTVMVENRELLSNQALSEPVTSSALNPPTYASTDRLGANSMDTRTGMVISGYINHTEQNAPPVASQLPQHIIPDPLQNELERLRRSADEAIRIHEETKLKVKSDRDREIEEAIAQIHRKYEIKHQEMETEFMLRKLELDVDENKILMSKIVAVAFRSKWMDMKASIAEASSSPMHQQLAHILSQHTAQRRAVFAGPSGRPASSVQTTATPAASLPTTTAAVPHSSSFFSSIPSRPPHISSRVSPTLSHQVGRSGIRAHAPHLQPFRPSTSLASTSLPSSVLPSLPSNPRPTTLLLSPCHLLPPFAAYNSGLYNRASGHEASGVATSLPNPSHLAMDTLMDFVENSNSANQIPPCSFLSPSDLGSSLLIAQPESNPQNGTRNNPAQMSEPADIVCLSDDD